jgi:selenocysteine lyase/cysteine desulfurase
MSKIKLSNLYSTKDISFIIPDGDTLYFNGACHTPIAIQSYEASASYHELFGVCSGRGDNKTSANLDSLIDETRHLILSELKLSPSDWEVAFFNNATQALNVATNIIGHYLRRTSYGFSICYHPLSHNSLLLPAKKLAHKYKLPECEISLDLKLPERLDNTEKLIFMPYIDNVFGYDHYGYYQTTVNNRKFMGSQKPKQHIILDACQAGTIIFNPVKTNLPNLSACGAIAFSTHKLHSEHMGVLLIRKRYLKNMDLFEIDGINIGGGTIIGLNENNRPVLHSNYRGLEAGLNNEAAILAFGAWLHFLSTCGYDLTAEMKKHCYDLKAKLPNCIEPDIMNLFQLEQFKKLREAGFGNNNIVFLQSNFFTASEIGARLSAFNVEHRTGRLCVDYGFKKYQLKDGVRLSIDWSVNNDDEYKQVDRLITALAQVAYDLGEIKQKLNQSNTLYGGA